MKTLEIIEEQKKDFANKFVAHITSEKGNIEHDRAVIFFEDTVKIYDWHKRSIIQILEAEVERLEVVRENLPPYSADIKQPLRHAYQNEGYMRAIEEQITHLTDIINKLK